MEGVLWNVYCSCKKGLDWKTFYYKLAMHPIVMIRSKMYDLQLWWQAQWNGRCVTTLDRLKSWCHQSLRYLCIHTDGAWWNLKKYPQQKDIGNFPDRCIICLKSFFCWMCAITEEILTYHQENEKGKRRRIIWLHSLINMDYCSFMI